MKFRGPDHAALEYLNALLIEQPSAFDFLSRVEVCAHCGGCPKLKGGEFKGLDADGFPTWRSTKIVCAACDKTWRGVECADLRTPRSGDQRHDAHLRQRDALCALRPVFSHRPRRWTDADWLYHRVAYFAWLADGSYESVAQDGPEVMPTPPRPWTAKAVRDSVGRMRRKTEERLAAAGLLERGVRGRAVA